MRGAGFRKHIRLGMFRILPLIVLLCACNRRDSQARTSIEFNKVPPTGEGGPLPISQASGRVKGARTGEKVILYAEAVNGVWWVQPQGTQPFIAIKPDSSWETPTHLGIAYAALLVDPGYRPPTTTKTLPSQGAKVQAVTIVKGIGQLVRSPLKTVQFSGFEWNAMNAISLRNGTPYTYDAANASTDSNGRLHLRIVRRDNRWTCSQLILPHSFGYGTYRFTVEDISHLPAAAVLTLFTWDDLEADQNYHEMDIELSRWGDPALKNAQFVVQPYYVPENVARFAVPAGPMTYSFQWESTKVSFSAIRGSHDTVATHVFTSGIPLPGSESVSMNFCAFGFSKVPLSNDAEVVIDKFQYFP